MKTVIIVAHTLDGFIARSSLDPIDWTSKEDKKFFASSTKKAGVIVMGEKTYLSIGKPLKDRLNIVLTEHPEKYPKVEGAEFYNQSTTAVLDLLKERNFDEVFICGGSYTYTQFLKNRLVDEIWLTVEPVIFGKGLSNFCDDIKDISCSLLSLEKLNENTVHIKYKVNYGEAK